MLYVVGPDGQNPDNITSDYFKLLLTQLGDNIIKLLEE